MEEKNKNENQEVNPAENEIEANEAPVVVSEEASVANSDVNEVAAEESAEAIEVAEYPVEETATPEADVISGANGEVKEVKSRKKILTGKVVSNKPEKTILVQVVRQVAHPIYKKYYKQSKKFMAHDEHNTCKEGDTVRIEEHRPISKNKRWVLLDVVERAK